jgi:uncharacterized protein YndB with AHSA1/START domain
MSETLETTGQQTVLRMERHLRHPVEKVWRAITEPEQLSQWFPSDVEADMNVGGKVRFPFRNGEGPTLDGEVLELDPPRVFAFTWDDSSLRFELEPDGDGCVLRFSHTFGDRWSAASYGSGWTKCFANLEVALDGGPKDETNDGWQELHEQLVEKFGLDRGRVERLASGWVVRIERQMVVPPDEVRAATGDRWPTDGVAFEVTDGNGGGLLVVTQRVPTEQAGLEVLPAREAEVRDLANRVYRR